MHSTQSTFAVIVSAETFELLNAAGEVVGRLAAIAASFAFVGGSGLEMLHLDATVNDSALGWTQLDPDGTGQQVTLRGPSDIGVTDPPNVLLSTDPTTSRARLRAGRKLASPAIAVVDTSTTTAGNAQITMQATAGNFAATLVSVEAIAGGNGGTANVKVDGWTGEAFLNGSGVGAGDVSLRVGTLKRVRAQPGGLVEMLGGGGCVIAANNGAAITPAVNQGIGLNPTGTGSISLNGKTARPLVAWGQSNLAANIAPGFRAFVGPGIVLNNVNDGDLLDLTANYRILCTVAAGAMIGELQVFGPGGNVVLPQRVIATQWAVNHDASLSGQWSYTAALGAGAYTVAMVGGLTGGGWVFVAPDTWMTAKHYARI